MSPKVSIVMPVLNGERFIEAAIQSVLAQTFRDYELIVVDDGSTDGTAQLVNAFVGKLALQYVRHDSPRGIPYSMNDGVGHATGDLISFLDHDDTWLPDFLSTQVRYLDEHPSVGMVHCDFQTIDVRGSVIEESVAKCRQRKRPSGKVFRDLFMDSFIVGNSVLIRRECLTQVGLFDESLRWGDYHLWMRIARHYEVDYVSKALTQYRQHPTQSTRAVPASRSDEDSVAMVAIKKIIELYPDIRTELGEKRIRRRMASLNYDMAHSLFARDAMHDARIYVARALRLWPTNPRYLRLYLGSCLSPAHAKTLRRWWRRIEVMFSSKREDGHGFDRVISGG
jgi:glycosyltransferase involved in cell wall biosynthesis